MAARKGLRLFLGFQALHRRLLSTHHSSNGRSKMVMLNSLTGKKEELDQDRPLTWYTCGPTVYDHAHVGHARSYVAFDIVRRVLMHQGFTVFQVMGMTDIDDKIIAKARAEGLPGVEGVTAVARRFEREFFRDMAALAVLPPDAVARVTEHLPDIVRFVQDLARGGYAYRGAASGTVWFDTRAYGPRYGALEPSRGFAAAVADEDHRAAAAAAGDAHDRPGEKRDPRDFALWKPSPPPPPPPADSALSAAAAAAAGRGGGRRDAVGV